MLALQNLRLHRLDSSFSASQQAQIYNNNLTPLVRRYMALRDPKRKDPEIRDDLAEVRQEARDVAAWTVFQEEAASAMSGRAMGTLGATSTIGNPPDKLARRSKRIEPHDWEVVRYAEGATTQSKAWLDQNATKYNCRHVVTNLKRECMFSSDLSIRSKLFSTIRRRAPQVWSSARAGARLKQVTPEMLAAVRLLNCKRLMCRRRQRKLPARRHVINTHHGRIQQPWIKHIPIPVLRNLVLLQHRRRCTRTMPIQCQAPMHLVGGHVI